MSSKGVLASYINNLYSKVDNKKRWDEIVFYYLFLPSKTSDN